VWKSELRAYRRLIGHKRHAFWKTLITEQQSKPRQMWRSIDKLLGRGRSQGSDDVSAGDVHSFFDQKVSDIRASTSSTAAPSFVSTDCVLSSFKQVTHDDVAAAVRARPNKLCASDPVPTWLLKECSSELVPFLYRLLNVSLSAGVVPAAFKSAYICPLLKKADLDTADAKNYRPISNLTVLSKLLEKLVARQLIDYLSVNKLLPDRQSAYQAFRSTETAIAGLMSDILLALNAGNIALLDLSAEFDTVDHTILIQHLRTSFGLNDAVLSWFRSYLDERRQHMSPRRAVVPVHRPVWRATGVRTGTAPVHDVHCRRYQHRRVTTYVGAPVRQRHTSLQPVSPK